MALLMLNEPRESTTYFERAFVLEPNLTAAGSHLNAAKSQVAVGIGGSEAATASPNY
ncbi:hypothetical protein [Candidatus Magnetominusculus dajiuhuensis]|uniref:hypothetical protein n=1 Tax=Candidatus Magnetominusculus dajiuhuensis TaxID=3137712 RepID=UPI003B4319AF